MRQKNLALKLGSGFKKRIVELNFSQEFDVVRLRARQDLIRYAQILDNLKGKGLYED